MNEHERSLPARWFEAVWNQGSTAAIDEMLAPDAVVHGLSDAQGNSISGSEVFKEYHGAFRSAFPNVNVVVEDTISEGDKVVSRVRVTATHSGPGLGFAAADQAVEFTGITIIRVEDGRIAEAWNAFDFLGMFQQLGHAPVPSPNPG